MIRIFVKRLFRRLKYILQFKEMITWKYESCKNCGHCFKVCWSVKDSLWRSVMGVSDSGGGSFCVDCFIERARNKHINIMKNDITMELFTPYE